MLRRLSGAASGALRRSLCSPPSRPPRALIQLTHVDKSGVPAPGAPLHLDEPPFGTNLTVPANLVRPRPLNDSRAGVHGSVLGQVGATSSDGFLLVRSWESRLEFDVPTTGDHLESWVSAARNFSFTVMDTNTGVTRFVCNPLSGGELCRLPDLDGAKRTTMYQHLGFDTQSQGGHGPPDRYAVGEMFTVGGDEREEEGFLWQFLSETGKCEKFTGLPPPLPAGRRMDIDMAMVPLGDRLWWIDKSWGAISVDPLSERLKLRLVKLPSGSVLPPHLKGVILMGKHDRCSEGKILYMEMSDKMPTIGALDPPKCNAAYLLCGNQLLGEDMVKGKLIGTYIWLESSNIPDAGWSNQTTIKREASAPPASSSTAAPPSPPHVRLSLHALPRPKLVRRNFSTAAKLPLDAEDSSVPLNSDYLKVPFWWWPANKREPIWNHEVDKDQEGTRMHPLEYVAKYPPVDSVVLFAETKKTDMANSIGEGIVSSTVVLLEAMKQWFHSFYDPVTVDSFSIDRFGSVQIASGVLLRLGSKTSAAVDAYLTADVLELLLSHGRSCPVHLPEVADLLQLMRSPWKLQGYTLLIHTASMPACERGHALIHAHALLMKMKYYERNLVLSKVDSDGWGDIAVSSLLLVQWYYHAGAQFSADDPEDQLVYCRNCESHILAYRNMLELHGFVYSQQDLQSLLHVKYWKLLCRIYQSLWQCRKLESLNVEEHFCREACCPLSVGCVRYFCYLDERDLDKVGPDPEWAMSCLRIVQQIRQTSTPWSLNPDGLERPNQIYTCFLTELKDEKSGSDPEFTETVVKIIQIVPQGGGLNFDILQDEPKKILDSPSDNQSLNYLELSVTKGEPLEVLYEKRPWTFVKKVGRGVGRRSGLVLSTWLHPRRR